jgi:general secretion pathway protein A
MDYLEFYGLKEEPFSQAPILKFYFNSAQHSRAVVRLMYAVDTMKGLAVLIGDIGTGKTILARRMLDSLPEEEYESALLVIIHSHITADWLLTRIARQIGVEDPAPEKLKLLNQLYNRLVELHDNGKKAVVLIDEAQMLQSREIMEEFRGLLNLEMDGKLITFVFFGLPELEDYLHLDEPLAQRIALKCRLESFNRESSEGYINHRLRLAGAKNKLFVPKAIDLIHHYSLGVPRLINTICDNCLFEGFLMKQKTIDEALVRNIVADLGLLSRQEKRKPGMSRTAAGQAQKLSGTISEIEQASEESREESTETELEIAMESAGLAESSTEETAEKKGEFDQMLDELVEEKPEKAAKAEGKNTAPPADSSEKNSRGEDIDSMLDDLEDK